MVGDHGHDVHGQLAGAGAEEQVVETVAELGDHHQHPALRPVLVELPAHSELLGHGHDALPQPVRVQVLARGRGDVHAHEEVPEPPVVELGELDDGAPVSQDSPG